MIYGVRDYKGTMMRFFSTMEQAQDFVSKQEYSSTCYKVEPYSDIDFANFVLSSLHQIDAIFESHKLF